MFSYANRIFVAIFILLSIEVSFNRAFDVEKDVVFQLNTPEFPITSTPLNASDSKSITGSVFKSHRHTVIFCHETKSKENMTARYKDAYLKIGNYNFIGVDWINDSGSFSKSKDRVPLVAAKLANLLDTLVAGHRFKLQNVTIVGHGLGAHIAGQAAKLLKSADKLGCIVGLDPAVFNASKTENRLDKSDAEYVQVIHTDGDNFGMMEPIGHADFYPNGGKDQPGCAKQTNRNKVGTLLNKLFTDEKCSHVRAHDLFLESLTSEFKAVRCGSFQEIQQNICRCDNTVEVMGGDIAIHRYTSGKTSKPTGIFYLETKDKPPYAKPDYLSFNRKFSVYTFSIF